MSMPFDLFSWMFHFPLSGNVAQRIFSPAITVNYAGDAAIEERVVSDVASYGKQIGWLSEIVLALAQDKRPDRDTVQSLAGAIEKIEDIKQQLKKSTLASAVEALNQLKEEQPEAYRSLMNSSTPIVMPVGPALTSPRSLPALGAGESHPSSLVIDK